MAKQTYTLNDMFALYVADLVRRNRKTSSLFTTTTSRAKWAIKS